MTITATAPRAAAYRGRLRWWTELPLIAVVYALYSGARLLVRGDVSSAVQHGADILHFEQIVHIDPERWFNRLFTDHAFLGVPADFAYASLHYIVTPTVLVWLWRRRPTHYRMARTWLMLSTLIGLIGFTLMPTAPPRLLTGHHGFIDTMAQYGSYGWWGSEASAPRGMGDLTNQYAAMPSLHVGWSLWCGIMLFRYGRHWTVRTLGVIYPLMTAFVVMGTANHYLLDAAAGVLVMGIGFLLAKPALRMVDALYTRYGFGRPAAARGEDAADASADTATGALAGTAAAVAAPAGSTASGGAPRDATSITGTASAAPSGGEPATESADPAAAPSVPRPTPAPDDSSGTAPLPDGEPAARN
ncbi:phosphatase PAP2 family protein [Streptomyces sp. NPDC087270]|uniref:phosphatase PAP2 family protein n=1 Tax=Streptomyces sp. NPDC087270 TaxID=3365774 RepID=UPI0037FFA85C